MSGAGRTAQQPHSPPLDGAGGARPFILWAGRSFGNQGAWHRLALYAEPLALPFAPQSLDLLVLPHALEASPDPHAVLREAERVLVPEGRVVIIGFNPLSAWGVHVLRAQLCARWGGDGRSNLPSGLQLVGAPACAIGCACSISK